MTWRNDAVEQREDPVLEFLESVKGAAIEQGRCLRKVMELDAQCQSITAQMRDTPGGGSGDKHRDALWASLADQRDRYWERYMATETRRAEVDAFIGKLPNPTHRAVLSLHYVDLLKWPRVEAELRRCGVYYSERQIFRLRESALEAAREIWRELNPEGRSLGDEDFNSETQDI